MSAHLDSLTNRGEYLSAHYVADQLTADLKKGVFATWALREGDPDDPRKTPREQVRALRGRYLSEDIRGYFVNSADQDNDLDTRLSTFGNPEWIKRLADWHQEILQALGHKPDPAHLTVHRAGREYSVPVAFYGHGIVALDCGWATDADAAFNPNGAGQLHAPLHISGSERYETGAALTTWLFQSELDHPGGPRPRFVLLLHGSIVILADRNTWSEGRYLAANLDSALQRNDRAQLGELATIAALFSADMLRPGDNDQSPAMDALLKASGDNAVGVDIELRYGLQRSVEVIANEVLARMGEPRNNVTPADIESPKMPFARELTRECLRYLYRILFLLYAEARPELGILPADDGSYEAGYSMARLRELVAKDEELIDEEARNGFHLYLSLDVLFTKVNLGHRAYGSEPDDDQPGDDEETRKAKKERRSEDRGLRFEALRSELFDPAAIRLIGDTVLDPHVDEDDTPRALDLRLRNSTLNTVLRLLTMKKAKRGERGGFISYRNLGINQLGAVYEGLMSYTGIIADEELCEVAKAGDPEQGSWLIPSHRQEQYPDETLVKYTEDDARRGLRGVKKYEQGSFVYRLAGRDRETSASYYTPESLTKVTVELALKHLLDQETDTDGHTTKTRAAKLLSYKICEPALGSGAFLNEAINQVADEYLRRRQDELGVSIPAAEALTARQKVKAYIALHNAYGVDLNATGVELAEVSLWLNTMHPGMRAPWFGLHLRRGNSLIGARRSVYAGDDVSSPAKAWLKAKGGLAPRPLPFLESGQPQFLPDEAIHQFLLPSPGWAAITSGKETKEAKELAPREVAQLNIWKKGILQRPKRSGAHLNKDGSRKLNSKTKQPTAEAASEFTRLRDAARRVEFLWALVVKRMEISEREIARHIDIWGANPSEPEFDFLHKPSQAVPKEKVFEELFNAPHTPYWRLKKIMDAWCALWFWPLDQVDRLDGTDPEYANPIQMNLPEDLAAIAGGLISPVPDVEAITAGSNVKLLTVAPRFAEPIALFQMGAEQMSFDEIGETPEATVGDGFGAEPPSVKKKSSAKAKNPPRRRTIPLNNMNDWLDFLEAMVGTSDVPEGTLMDNFETLDELRSYEEQLPSFMGMDTANPEDRFPWTRTVRDISDEQGFLHWELDFALVFARNGGFDLQVGNPPWVRPRWDENAVLAEFEPWFKLKEEASESEISMRRNELLKDGRVFEYLLTELTNMSGQRTSLSSAQIYPLLRGTQTDLYRAFMCQIWGHSATAGAVGLLHPDTHFAGDKEALLREEAYHRLRVHGDFVNPGHRFFPEPVGESSHFGVHIYGPRQAINFDHLSWLVSVDALRLSFSHTGEGEPPGIRYKGRLDERPHSARIIKVNEEILSIWRRLQADEEFPIQQARLLFPVSTAEAKAIETLASYEVRLNSLSPDISDGFHESGAKKLGFMDYNRPSESGQEYQPATWDEVILKGPQLGVATPVFKRHDANTNDPFGADLTKLPLFFVPDTAYIYDKSNYELARASRDQWIDHANLNRLKNSSEAREEIRQQIAEDQNLSPVNVTDSMIDQQILRLSTKPYTDFFRLAWRERIAPDTERSLYVALIPPGPAHTHAIRSAQIFDYRMTALIAGMWAAIPIDYLLRATGTGHLDVGRAVSLPAPAANHPLADALLLRALRLNCVTSAWSKLWADLYDPAWEKETWARDWPGLGAINSVAADWQLDTPLRAERDRRSALVEIDALVAVWLGLDADELIAAYRGRFPVLQRFESVTWFDSNGWKLAGNPRTLGQRQSRDSWAQLQLYLEHPLDAPVPVGYTAPFYKADREAEMREAHAVFQARLDAAVARGEWDPQTREVPTS